MAHRSLPSHARLSCALALLATACVKGPAGGGDPAPGASGEYGSVVLALTSVPADVQCVRVTVTGSSTVVRTFPVMAGSSATLPIAGLPLGNATVYEDTFDMACSLVGPASVPTWVATAPVPVVLSSSMSAAVTIVLRRPAGLQIGMDYQDNGLTVSPTSRDYGQVLVNSSSAPASFTITNTGSMATGVLAVALGGANPSQFAITGNTCAAALAVNATCAVSVILSPTSTGPLAATLTVSSGASSTTATLSGAGVTNSVLGISPAAVDFGSLGIGTSAVRAFTISNTGGSTSGPLTALLTGASDNSFVFNSNLCEGLSLMPGGSCVVAVAFSPGSTGAKTATLSVTSAGILLSTVTAALSGTGLASSGLTLPVSVNYGTVFAGQIADQIVTLTNNGPPSGAVTVALGGTDANAFSIVTNNCAVFSLGTNATCTMVVRFSPTIAGPKAATLTASSPGAGSSVATLQGQAVSPGSLQLSPAMFSFGNVTVGQGLNQNFDVLNGSTPSGALTVTLSGADASQFIIVMNGCVSLAPGAGCSISVRFAPTSTGSKSATLTVTTAGGSSTTSALSGSGIAGGASLTMSPTSLDFGSVTLNTASMPRSVVVTNTGNLATQPLQVAVGSAAFTIIANNCSGATLAPGSTCTVQMQFVPVQIGPAMAVLTVSGGATSTSASLAGSGAGLPVLTPSPASLSFTNVPVGSQSAFKTVVVTNTGNAASKALVMNLGGTDASHFQLGGGTCQGATVPAGGTCTAVVRFAPNTVGNKTASISLAEVGGGVSLSIALTGTVVNWNHLDVGDVGTAAGSWTQALGQHTVRGAGIDIWGNGDAFHFTWVPISGNATITARVVSIQQVDDWSKAVVMMRDGTTAGATYVAAVAPADPSHQYRRQFRQTAGQASNSVGAGSGQPGAWLRVSRVNNTFTASFSTDGINFQPLAPATIDVTMSQSINVGIGVTSHKAGSLATGMFDNVSITQP